MQLALPMKVTYRSKQYALVARIAEMIDFERKFGESVASLGDDMSMEKFAFIAYAALRRRGAISKVQEFDDDFLDGLEDIEVEIDEDGQLGGGDGPTEAAA